MTKRPTAPAMPLPKTTGEFATSDYFGKMLTLIRGFNLPGDPEDIAQDILCRMLSATKGDYIGQFRADGGGSFSNWVTTFAKNHCINVYNRERKTVGGVALNNAASIVPTVGDDGKPEPGTVAEDSLPQGTHAAPGASLDTVALSIDLDAVCKVLQAEYKTHSWVVYSDDGKTSTIRDHRGSRSTVADIPSEYAGKTIPRHPAVVLRMMREGGPEGEGMTQKQIAAALKTSKTYVQSVVRKLKGRDDLRAALTARR